jgi:light-harvesting complex I chlorophyll a/b binding protein 4
MLGVAGVLGQEILRPDVFWYEAGLPENLPGPFKNINMGGLLAFEFLMMHFVEVRRWQDIKNFGSVNEVGTFRSCQLKDVGLHRISS